MSMNWPWCTSKNDSLASFLLLPLISMVIHLHRLAGAKVNLSVLATQSLLHRLVVPSAVRYDIITAWS